MLKQQGALATVGKAFIQVCPVGADASSEQPAKESGEAPSQESWVSYGPEHAFKQKLAKICTDSVTALVLGVTGRV